MAARLDDTEAADLLKQSGEAISKLNAISYSARAFGEGPLAKGTPEHNVVVTAARAEAGGWKLAATGIVQSTTSTSTPQTKLDLGYDGATAWSIREREKEARSQSIRRESDLESFFKQNSCAPAIAWEMLGEKPFAMQGTATMDGEGNVGGEACRIVKITGIRAGDDDASTARVYIGVNDHLPRRFEKIREVKDTDGGVKTLVRVLEMSGLKVDGAVAMVPFTLSVPDGYMIRGGQARRDRDADKDNPLKGPGVRDAKKDDKDAKDGMGDKAKPAMAGAGQKFPDFELKDAEGKEVTLESLKGNVVVLDFWATWCGWCIKAMPDVQRVHDKYKDKAVKVYGVNVFEKNPKDAIKFKKDKKYTYGLLLNGDPLAEKLRISGIPVIIVIDQEGKVVERIGGYRENLDDYLGKLIDGALEKKVK